MKNVSLILLKILKEKNSLIREKLIEEFQNAIWLKDVINENDPLYNIFNQLAYDFEFYEPNPKLRDESSYGEDRLEKEIMEVLDKIEKMKK